MMSFHYPIEIEIKNTIDTARSALNNDLHLEYCNFEKRNILVTICDTDIS
jgi:hypothetical protein